MTNLDRLKAIIADYKTTEFDSFEDYLANKYKNNEKDPNNHYLLLSYECGFATKAECRRISQSLLNSNKL